MQQIKADWWASKFDEKDFENIECSNKFWMMFKILAGCETRDEKLLVFSQNLVTLDVVEHMLKQKGWESGQDYFRLDGSTKIDAREKYLETFNRIDNKRGRYVTHLSIHKL